MRKKITLKALTIMMAFIWLSLNGVAQTSNSDYKSTHSVTISEIQDTTGTGEEASPYADSTVLTTGTVVDTVSDAYYIQDGKGPWNGIKVMDDSNTPNPGDSVEIEAIVAENYGFTRLESISSFATISTGNDIPAADTNTTSEVSNEKYEGVYIYIKNATCTNSDAGYGQWEINDGSGALLVDDDYYAYSPTRNAKYDVKGFGHYSFSARKILPTENADVVAISPEFSNIATIPEIPTSDDAVTISADITSETSTIDTAYLAWGTTSGSLNDTVGMVHTTGDTYEAKSEIPAQSENTEVFYTITAGDNQEDTTATEEMSYLVSGSPITISEIQDTTGTGSEASPYAGKSVVTSGTVVKTVSNAYYIQDGTGAWNGIKVMDANNTPNPGDSINIKADVVENYGFTRLDTLSGFTIVSTGNDIPAADTVTTAEAAVEKYEGVYIYIKEATCTNPDAGYGQWEINDGSGALLVDDNYYAYSPTQDAKYNISGFGHYSYGDRKILPTEEADIELIYTGPTITDVYNTPDAPTSSDDVYVYANVNDANHTLDTVFLAYGTTSGDMKDSLGMQPTKQAYQNNTAIPPQSDETTVYYTITAINTNGDTTTTSEMTYTVYDPASTTLPYSELFGSGLGKLYTYSVSGDSKEWYHDSDGYAEANGYYSGDTEEDWLVIPALDFTQYSNNIKLSFSTWYNYGEDNSSNFLKLKYSTDYSGTGDPSSATWTEISFTKPSSSETWQSTGEIDLPDTSSTKVYLAFQYHYEPDYYRQWEIDSISIYDADKPVIKNYAITPAIPVVDDKVEISAEVTDAAGIDTVYAIWGKSSGNYPDTIGMSIDTLNQYVSDSKIPSQTEGTDIYYRIIAENINSAKTETPEQSYTVISYPELTIEEIQYTEDASGDSPEKGNIVTTSGIVTGVSYSGYYIQTQKGPWHGLYIYDDSNDPTRGEEIKVTGLIDEYFGLTEMKNIQKYEVLSTANTLPAMDTVDISTASSEGYESVLTRVEDVVFISNTELGSEGNKRSYPQMYEEATEDTILMDNDIYDFSLDSLKPYNIQGVVDYSWDHYMILPRMEEDIEFAGNVLPEITDVIISPENPSADEQVQINATITDGNPDDNISATLRYGTSQDNLSNTADFTNQGTGSETDYAGIIPGQPAGTTVYFEIEASDSDTTSSFKEGQYQVADEANAIIDKESLTLKVYPNPGNGQYSLEIESEIANSYRVAVFNTVGKIVYQNEFGSHSVKQTINLTDQNDGIYFLKVTGKNTNKVIKLIKE
jgi:hypothetical protein